MNSPAGSEPGSFARISLRRTAAGSGTDDARVVADCASPAPSCADPHATRKRSASGNGLTRVAYGHDSRDLPSKRRKGKGDFAEPSRRSLLSPKLDRALLVGLVGERDAALGLADRDLRRLHRL